MEETGDSSPQLSPSQKFTSAMNPFQILKFPCIPLLISFIFLLRFPTSQANSIQSSNIVAYYAQKCNHMVPESPTTDTHFDFSLGEDKILHFDIAYFTGGPQILPKTADSFAISLSFHPKRTSIFLTHTPHVLKLQATLRFHLPPHFNLTWRRNLREIHFRPPRIPIPPETLDFELYGFWSMDTGKLCMVGSGSTKPNLGGVSSSNVVLKLNYPAKFANISSLITGVLESLNGKDSLGYFESISILGLPHHGGYKYALIDNGSADVCLAANDGENENLRLEWSDPSSCLTQLYRFARTFELEYGRDCGSIGGTKCDPLGGASGSLPKLMTIQGIRCDQGSRIQLLIGFSNTGFYGSGPFSYERVFDPNRMLIGEGIWDEKKDRLCVVACRVLNVKDSLVNASVGDCSVRLSLRFPRTLTISKSSTVVGLISSTLTVMETGYFDRIRFHGSGPYEKRIRGIPGLKYKYTMLNRVNKSCSKRKTMRGRGQTYPRAYSSDMRFHMSVKNGRAQIAHGYVSPLFVSDQLYKPYGMSVNLSGLLNISYKISLTTTSDLKLGNRLLSNESVEISAEGAYDNETGVLCMIGCLHQMVYIENSTKNDCVDCEILVNIQFSPLNAKAGDNTKGTIKSMRGNSDPLYFGQLEISSDSIYTSQASEFIWRMDLEITMVLISNTFACVFVALQLYHVRKHPHVLPFISLVMLMVVTFGYMIPLLLNFEAMFTANHSRQNVFFESGGWLEVNEVIVRVVTMVAFLLQFRLLQLNWSARRTDGSHTSLWLSEKRVLCLSLPLYIGGGLIAWYVHEWKNSARTPYLPPRPTRYQRYQQNYQWIDLKSYAGLILDGFLLPQIMFNVFSNCKENTLASPFYFGKTIIRILPHAYDLYREHSSSWSFDMPYIYGNRKQDFYSTSWDIIIPFVGLVFAGFIYLQQQFGGRCIVPKRFRGTYDYEKIPALSIEEVQGQAAR